MMNTYLVTVNHGVLAQKENERTFFVEGETEREAYVKSKENLLNCGNDGYEYVVGIEIA